MITITMNEDFTLSCDTNIIPAQYSSNIPFSLVLPAKYNKALVVPGFLYYDGCRKVESAIDNYENGRFTVPAEAFSKEGILAIAFSITVGNITETTTIIEFEVKGSVDTSFSLPAEVTWQSMLQNFMDQYMDKVYSSVIDELIAETETLQINTAKLQVTVNGLIKTVNDLVASVNNKLNNGDFTPRFTLGTVETGAPGTSVVVTQTGTQSNPILNFVIPRGSQGIQGLQGLQGIQGIQGPIGPAGPTTFKIDNVVQSDIVISSTRDISASVLKAQIKSKDGKVLLLETGVDQVNLKRNGKEEVNLKTLLTTIATAFRGVALYDSQEDIEAKNELLEFMEVK